MRRIEIAMTMWLKINILKNKFIDYFYYFQKYYLYYVLIVELPINNIY